MFIIVTYTTIGMPRDTLGKLVKPLLTNNIEEKRFNSGIYVLRLRLIVLCRGFPQFRFYCSVL